MQILAAYMLLVVGGASKVTVADLAKVLDAVGITIDTARAEKFLAGVEGKTIDELIAAGEAKLATVVVAGGSGAGSGSGMFYSYFWNYNKYNVDRQFVLRCS
jgi:large subunit ribosomal protein LP2